MKVASAVEMNRIDRLTQDEYKVSGAILMERAALAVRNVIQERFGSGFQKVYIFCGKGNNGGDGLALARLLLETTAQVTVVLAFEPGLYHGLALESLIAAEKYGAKILFWERLSPDELRQSDLIVDALLGTGAAGAPRGAVAEIISLINQSGKPVVSIDIPSGINVDGGGINGVAVKATVTVTFGLPKTGLLIYPGAETCGDIIIDSIGFPRALLESETLKMNRLDIPEAREMMPKRPHTAHKGSNGQVLVVGGAKGMTGAVALCSLGALRAGAGLVTAGVQDQNAFPEKPSEVMSLSWDKVITFLEKADVIIFGPGASTQEESKGLLLRILTHGKVPLIIDADGLNLLATDSINLCDYAAPLILTPHPGEMSRLTKLTITEVQANRLELARSFAKDWGIILVLKGAGTIIADPNENIYFNPTGNPGMATAGMGDALAGIIGGLLAQGVGPTEAAAIGTYLHGMAGDLAADEYGPRGIIATDLLREFPGAVKKVLGNG